MGVSGMVSVCITSADIAQLLRVLHESRIEIHNAVYLDDLRIRMQIRKGDLKRIEAILKRRGDRFEIMEYIGFFWTILQQSKSIILLGTLFIIIVLTVYIPTRVFFVRVEGNSLIPTSAILENAERCGIEFGASRREVRSEKVKNALLAYIPELQWVGINTKGCVATISIREKTIQETGESFGRITSIVAKCDAIIESCTVQQGSLQCQIGQAVEKDQLLVSAYTDCGLTIQAVDAQAEIFGQTFRTMETIIPTDCVTRGSLMDTTTRYSVLIGKKLINFYKDSGISDGTCVKMYKTDYLTLPGGFQLPFAIITEWIFKYETAPFQQTSSEQWLENYTLSYLKSQMIAGQVLQARTSYFEDGVLCRMHGQYICLEMIGQSKEEEIFLKHGEDE